MTTTAATETRVCSICGQTKPLEDYYPVERGIQGRMAHCRRCNNQRPPTEARTVRTRARHRATAELVDLHRAEFEALLEVHTTRAAAELDLLREAASAERREDVNLPRLKPGPKRKDENTVVKRLDVARCPACHRHHDAGHVCENCGTRPETVVEDLDLDDVAIERRMAGDLSIALNRNEETELARLWLASGRPLAECQQVAGVDAQYLLVTTARRRSVAS